jgi:hypothetical protein
MIEITIAKVQDRYTFLINGRGDAVYDPQWGITTFATPEAAREAAEHMVRTILEGGLSRPKHPLA